MTSSLRRTGGPGGFKGEMTGIERRFPHIRSLMEPTEISLLDALLSTRQIKSLDSEIWKRQGAAEGGFYELHFACAEGDVYKVKRLIDSGDCDINQRFLDLPDGSTPLHWAATGSSNAVVIALLERGADPNFQTKKGMTALHIACQLNHVDTITKLVQGGADITIRDRSGVPAKRDTTSGGSLPNLGLGVSGALGAVRDEAGEEKKPVGKAPLDYVFHDPKDKHANPFYPYLHSLLVDEKAALKTRMVEVKDKLKSKYATMEEKAIVTGQGHRRPSLRHRRPSLLDVISAASAAAEQAAASRPQRLPSVAPAPSGVGITPLRGGAGGALGPGSKPLSSTSVSRAPSTAHSREGGSSSSQPSAPVSAGGPPTSSASGAATAAAVKQAMSGGRGNFLKKAAQAQISHMHDVVPTGAVDASSKGMEDGGHETSSRKMMHRFSVTVANNDEANGTEEDEIESRKGLVNVIVGGVQFAIRKAKLQRKVGCVILEALEERDRAHAGQSHRPPDLIFADRSPKLFGLIAKHIEGSGAVELPAERGALEELLDEAEFYHLPQLCSACKLRLERLDLRRVGRGGNAVHTSIGEAIRVAKEGEQIVVDPGVYPESLTVAKNVSILADCGPGEQVKITGDGSGEPTIRIKSGSVLLSGLSISWAPQALQRSLSSNNNNNNNPVGAGASPFDSASGGEKDAGARGCCLEVVAGGLALVDSSTFLGPSAYGVFVHPLGRANLQKCRIKGTSAAGVTCAGSITMQLCDVESPGAVGIGVVGEAIGMVRRCIVKGAGDCGILVQDMARGTWTGNEVYNCGLAGVAISSIHPETIFRVTTSCDNAEAGLLIYGGGRPTISGAKLFRNSVAGLVVIEESDPNVSGCQLRENAGCGILLDGQAKGHLRLCEVQNNTLAGVAIKGGAETVVEDCSICGGSDSGVVVYDGGKGVVRDCKIEGNAAAGVTISKAGNPLIQRCKISKNAKGGACIVDAGLGRFDGCEIHENKGAQVQIATCREPWEPVFDECDIHHGDGCGIMIRTGGSASLRKCKIRNNGLIGLLVASAGAYVLTTDTEVKENGSGGYYVCDDARAGLVKCEVKGNEGIGILIKSSNSSIEDCEVSDNAGHGACFTLHSSGSIDKCTIANNQGSNVLIEGNSTLSIKDSTLTGARESGVLLLKGATSSLSRNTITGNRPCGIAISDSADPKVFSNQVTDNTPYGLLVTDGGMGHIYSNTIAKNDLAQLVLSHASRAIAHDNTITAGANGVEVCWSDEEMRVRAVTNVQLQRLGVGPPGPGQRRVKERIFDDTPVAVLARKARLEQQKQAEAAEAAAAKKAGATGPHKPREEPKMDDEVSARLAEVTDKIDAIAKGGGQGDGTDQTSNTITSGLSARTPSPAPTGMLTKADAINLMREKGIPGAGGAIKVLDGRASKRELSVTISTAEMARAHVADDAITSDDEARGSPDSTDVAQDPAGGSGGGEGGQGSEAQGMGQPFGLSI